MLLDSGEPPAPPTTLTSSGVSAYKALGPSLGFLVGF